MNFADEENIWYCKDRNGIEWIAESPDQSSLDSWFNNILANFSLDYLTNRFPYQLLKADKEIGRLVPIYSPYSAPISRLTNCFHTIYQNRMNT